MSSDFTPTIDEQVEDFMTKFLNVDEADVAIQGYEPVTYFTGEPTPGNPELTATYDGATYYFATAANQAEFEADPAHFVPQYGGFWAVAVSEGKTFPVDPQTYEVSDGKLYLFYNGELGNTKPQWEAAPVTRRTNAKTHYAQGIWSRVRGV